MSVRENKELEDKVIKYGVRVLSPLGAIVGFKFAGLGGAIVGAVMGYCAGFILGCMIIPLMGTVVIGGAIALVIAAIIAIFAVIGLLWNVGKP